MSKFVIDAGVAIKWVIPETGTEEALTLLRAGGLCAPDLITAECANILWKKQRRGEITSDEAMIAARLLEQAELEIIAMRTFLAAATKLAMKIDHPAYDCLYLVLALERDRRFVTADDRLVRKLAQQKSKPLSGLAMSLSDVALTKKEKAQ